MKTGLYGQEFRELVRSLKDNTFIGWGNPSAHILLLGVELAEANNRNNVQEWKDVMSKSIDYGSPESKPECRNNPLIVPGDGRTWKGQYAVYRRFIEKLFDIPREGSWMFMRYCFCSELSAVAGKNQKDIPEEDKLSSIKERIEMFKHSYFRRFTLIIAPVGTTVPNFMPDMFIKAFGCTYDRKSDFIEVETSKNLFINRNPFKEREGLLVHTPQFSARARNGANSDCFLEKIVKTLRESIPNSESVLKPECW